MKTYKQLNESIVGMKRIHSTLGDAMPDEDLADFHHEKTQYHADMHALHARKSSEHLAKGDRRGFFAHNVASERHSNAALNHHAASESLRLDAPDLSQEFQSTHQHEARLSSLRAYKASLKARRYP